MDPIEAAQPSQPTEVSKFPHEKTPPFTRGQIDYDMITFNSGSVNPQTGERHTQGIEFFPGKRLWIGGKTPEDYAKAARQLNKSLRGVFERNPQAELPFVDNLPRLVNQPDKLDELSRKSTPTSLSLSDLSKIGIHMTGFGKAALDKGDLRTAIIAFDTAGALKNPQIKAELMAAAKAQGLRPLDLLTLQAELTAEQKPEIDPVEKKSRPRRRSLQGEAPTIDPNKLYSNSPLTELSHTGTSRIYVVGGEDGRSLVKYPPDSAKLHHEIQTLKAANGAGGLPQLEYILKRVGRDDPEGIQIEKIQGSPLHKMRLETLTPENFGLSNRMWLIYDLFDTYQATGLLHGDLFDTDTYVRIKDSQIKDIAVNLDNMILENGSNRIRMIDYGLDPIYKRVENIVGLKAELSAAVEFLFTQGLTKSLPTSPELKRIGEQMLRNIDALQSPTNLKGIIPPEAQLPGE